MIASGETLTGEIKEQALSLGFDLVGFTPVQPPRHGRAFTAWLEAGYQGEMAYLPARAALRSDPGLLAPGARSMIVLAVSYNPGPPPAAWNDPGHGRIARYAWAPDYHDTIKPRLYALDEFIRQRTGREAPGKACVDTAPLLERDFAMAAGLGFTGRNTCLITPKLGSWTFLAALLVPEALAYDSLSEETPQAPDAPVWTLQTGKGTCGSCVRCLVACPTRAFAGPHVLDARRCISYLTIELRGPIPRDLRPLMGNWVFGCDVCQEVCPYNRDAPIASSAAEMDAGRAAPSLLDLLGLDETAFRQRYRGTPVLRTKRRGLVRNACVAAGNWGNPAATPALLALLQDQESLVRGHAAWALGQIAGRGYEAKSVYSGLRTALAVEKDSWVREEIGLALGEAVVG